MESKFECKTTQAKILHGKDFGRTDLDLNVNDVSLDR